MLRRGFSVAVYGAKRTPIGAFQGKLSRVPASLLGAHAIAAALAQAGLKAVDEVYFGTVIGAGQGMNPARQAALASGLPAATVGTTVSKGDCSGLKAITLAADRVMLEPGLLVAAGGFENCSLAPHVVREYRTGMVLGDGAIEDCVLVDSMECQSFNVPLGVVIEKTTVKYDFLRSEQDFHAKESYIRAMSAWKRGFFNSEVAPMEFLNVENTKERVREDEYHDRIDFAQFPYYGALYIDIGSVTGANSATIADGGAALILGGENAAGAALARVHCWVDCSTSPDWFPLSLSQCILKLSQTSSFPLSRVDLFELDETFAACTLACQKELKLNPQRVNVNGGAIALGNPMGMTGARMVATMIYALKERQLKYGMVATCEGGGGATAALVEVL